MEEPRAAEAVTEPSVDPRGFLPEHQKLCLYLFPLERRAEAVTEIQLRSTGLNFETIRLNARQVMVKKVTINGEEADFSYSEATLARMVAENVTSGEAIQHPNRLKQALLISRDSFELTIRVPPLALTPPPPANDLIILRIEYDLTDNSTAAGLHFVLRFLPKVGEGGERIKYFQISAAAVAGMGRLWMPCFENDALRWDLEYHLCTEGLSTIQHVSQLHVASSGALCQQYVNGETRTKIFRYRLDIPSIPAAIAFTAGLFEMLRVPAAPFAAAYCPVGMGAKLSLAVEFFSRTFGFVNWYLSGVFPYPSYYIVFLCDVLAVGESMAAANMSLFSSLALFDNSIIDQNLITRLLVCEGIAQQYFGIRLRPAGSTSRWITLGLGGFLARQMLRVFHGNNEFRYGVRRDIATVLAFENGHGPIASVPDVLANPIDEEWLRLKSYLIILILENRLEKGGLQKILSHLWSELTSSDGTDARLSTTAFLKTAKKVSGKDMRAFADQWIFSAGCPVFTCTFAFNRKRSTIEVDLKQSTPGQPQKKVAGSLLIRVHELDGVFDHSVHIDDFAHHFELPVHAKAKKIKKKKKLIPQGGEAGGGGGGVEGEDGQSTSATNNNGKDEEEETFVSPLSWIRLDPEMEWIAALELHQPEFMLVEQLQNDRDVVAQHEAIISLRRQPSEAIVEAFERILNDAKCFYRIRIDAAEGLAVCAPNSDSQHHLGGLKLISFYNKGFALQSTETVVVPVPRSNNFESLQNYFILKALPGALATVRTGNATLMELVGQILLNMMRFNDNSGNTCSDNYHVAAIIDALAAHLQVRKELGIPTERLAREYVRELDRYTIAERIQPYYHNTVMVAVLRAWRTLRRIDIDHSRAIVQPEILLKEGNFINVRLCALEYLLSTEQTLSEETLAALQSLLARSHVGRGIRIATAEMLARISPRFIASRGDFATERVKSRLYTLIEDNAGEVPLVVRLLFFAARVVDIAAVDIAESAGGTPGRIALRISLPTAHELSSEGEANVTEKVIEEPDWFLEVAGEEGVPTTKLPKLRLSVMGSGGTTTPVVVPAALSKSLPSRLQAVLQNIWDNYDSFPFRYPVDRTVAGYYEIIKNPIDLSAIQGRIASGACRSVAQLCEDLRLMFDNCFFFNQPDSLISEQARRLRNHALKELRQVFSETPVKDIRAILMTKEPIVTVQPVIETKLEERQSSSSSKFNRAISKVTKSMGGSVGIKGGKTTIVKVKDDMMNFSEMERMQKIMERARAHPYAFWFLEPVDPIALDIPTYFSIVVEPMDLGTLQRRLESGEISTPSEFVRLLDLIFTNCTTFNSSNTVVHQNALEMQKSIQKVVKRHFPNLRTVSEGATTPSPADFPSTTVVTPVAPATLPGLLPAVAASEPQPQLQAQSRPPPTQLNRSVIKLTVSRTVGNSNSGRESPSKVKKLLITLPTVVAAKNECLMDKTSKAKESQDDEGWIKEARQILDRVCRHECALPFLQAVDPIALNIPSYPKVIKNPMDLSVISKKLASKTYSRPAEMNRDYKLMFSNCYKFNGRSAPISEDAKVLETFYDTLYLTLCGERNE